MVEPKTTTTLTPSPPLTRGAYRADIDALRAIAVIMVVAFHAEVPGFTGGFTGVDVFFVISGFVILRSLTDEQAKTGRVSWWAFYGRRFRRLAPAALLMIVVVVLLAMVLLNPIGEQQAVAKGAIAAATSTSNFYLCLIAGDYFVPTYAPNVFLHTWSLSVEEQFYLAVPILFVLTPILARRLGRDKRRVMISLIVLACLASLVTAVVLARLAPTQAFYLPFGRVYELGIGALLAVVNHSPARALTRRIVWSCSAAALVTVTVVGVPGFGFPGAWALIPTLATAGFIWAHVTREDPGGRFLLSRPMLGVGKLSYGWYLWHWPLLSIVATWYLREPPVWVKVILVLAALGIAIVSYRYWEPRFRSPADAAGTPPSVTGRRTVATGLTAIALTCALAFGSLLFADRVARTHDWTAGWHAKYDTAYPSKCTHLVLGTEVSPQHAVCPLDGFDPARPSVVVWGDSFAQMLLAGVVKAVDGRPVNVVALTRGACPPYLANADDASDIPYGLRRTRLDVCRQNNEAALRWVLDAVEGGSKVGVIMAARWPIYRGTPELYSSLTHDSLELVADIGPLMETGTPALIAKLGQAGVGADLYGLSPELSRPGAECVTRRWRTFDCDVSRDAEDQYWRGTGEWLQGLRADSGDRSRIIDPVESICDERVCKAERDGVINFADTNHLSAAAVEKLSDQIAPMVDDVLRSSVRRDR